MKLAGQEKGRNSDSTPARQVPPPPASTRPGAEKGTGLPKMPPGRTWLGLLLVLAANFWLARLLMPGPEAPVTVPYTLFKEEVGKGNVQAIYSRGDTLTGRFKAAVTYPPPGQTTAAPKGEPAAGSARGAPPHEEPKAVTSFATTLPSFVDPGLEAFLIEHGVEISAKPIEEDGSPWATHPSTFGPGLLFIGFYIWMFRRAGAAGWPGGGLMGIGKSKARRYDQETDAKVTFDDVAGIDEAENELVEIVDFLRDPPKYTRLGGTAPKGVLLVGAPGTGKTLLAKAVAGEAGVPFFSMSGSEFVEMIVGVGAARVRDLFKQAREHAPAIIFIDELDAIGRARGQMVIGGSSEQEQTLNQILSEMDGFSSREGIIVLAATNQPDVLDNALLRPGRFDRRVVVNLPDRTGREAILKVHTRGVPLASDVEPRRSWPPLTPGLSGADLKNLVNEAALLAARREQDEVHHKDFLDALEKIVLGPERPLLLSRGRQGAHRLPRGRAHDPGAGRARRRPGEPGVDRAARAGARRDLSASGQRPLQLPGGLSARADHRDARRPRGRGDRLRHQDDRRRERYRAGHQPGAAAWSRAGA